MKIILQFSSNTNRVCSIDRCRNIVAHKQGADTNALLLFFGLCLASNVIWLGIQSALL